MYTQITRQARLITLASGVIIRNGGVVVYPTDSGYALLSAWK